MANPESEDTSWKEYLLPVVRSSFLKFKRALDNSEKGLPLTKSANFKIAYFQLKRETLAVVKKMALHSEVISKILMDTIWLLQNARENKEIFDHGAPILLKVIEKHLKILCIDDNEDGTMRLPPFDTRNQWPDGPATDEGICWICNGDKNIRWLADPSLQIPKDREPWCKSCYQIRQKLPKT